MSAANFSGHSVVIPLEIVASVYVIDAQFACMFSEYTHLFCPTPSQQGVNVANPPTLLLLVDSLLQYFSDAASNQGSSSAHTCARAEGAVTTDSTCASGTPAGGGDSEMTLQFLAKAQPLLDQWMRWLLVTQRPGAKGWGGTESESPVGAFQVRFVDLCLVLRRFVGYTTLDVGAFPVC